MVDVATTDMSVHFTSLLRKIVETIITATRNKEKREQVVQGLLRI